MRNDLRVLTLNEGMSEYETFLWRAATGRKTVYENIVEMEGQQALADQLPQPFPLSVNWRLLCVGTGDGSTCGAILCPTEPGTAKLCTENRSLFRADIQGRSEEHQSLHQHTQGRAFFSASWHRHTTARLFCMWGWLYVSPGLVEAALPALCCSHRGCGPESGVACFASLPWARSAPLGPGTLAELWRGL